MAHLPHMMNISVRPHHPEPWRWHHDWETHQHSYSRVVTFHLMRAHPGPEGWIPLTIQTILTLDLSESNPFARPPTPAPPQEEEDLMDIDLFEDYIFRGPGEDSNRESHNFFASIPVHVAVAAEEVHSSSKEVIFTDSNPSEDGSGGKDEVMLSPEAESSCGDKDEEMSPTEEEDEEEDSMEDAS